MLCIDQSSQFKHQLLHHLAAPKVIRNVLNVKNCARWLIYSGRAYLAKDNSVGSLAHLRHAKTLLHLTMSVDSHAHISISTTNTLML